MARYNGPVKVLNPADGIPSDAEGGVAGGDSTAAAVAQVGAEAAKWVGTNLAPGTDLNTVDQTGRFLVLPGNAHPNRPQEIFGLLEVFRFGSSSKIQTWTSADLASTTYRRYGGSTGWTAWARIDAGGVTSTVTADLDSKIAATNPAVVGAPLWRVLPLALTAGGGAATHAATSGGLRHRLRVPAEVARWRVHVRDINARFGIVQSSTLTVAGVWIGAQGATPGRWTAAPTKVSNGGTATSGADWVSGWISTPLAAGTWHTLGISWSSTAQPQANRTTAWTTTQADTATPGAATTQTTAPPFDVWLECEVPASVPAVAVISDSLGVGVGSTYGVTDSWPAQLAQTQGLWPILMGSSGDLLTDWTNPAHFKWSRFGGTAKPDSVVIAAGSNDIFTGSSLASVQSTAQTVASLARERLAQAVYVTTILPREGVTGAQEDTRRAYNTWLGTLPAGVRDRVDIVPAVSTDDETLIDSLDADGVHLNTAGYAAIAASITRPLAPKPAATAAGITDATATGRALITATDAAAARAAIGAASDQDTGWRNIGASSGVTGNVFMRRRGPVVHLMLQGIVVPTAGHTNVADLTSGFIPQSFTGANWRNGLVMDDAGTSIRMASYFNSRMRILNAETGKQYGGYLTWITNDAWPTTLPGSPA